MVTTDYDSAWRAVCRGDGDRGRGFGASPFTLCHALCLMVNGPSKPRNLPTARITRSSLSQELTLPPQTAWLVPILFQLLRLLSVVPAVFGTLWNLYRVFRPPDGLAEWRVDYAVSMLWVRPSRFSTISAVWLIPHQSILTGWQCLQLTTGLLKRWRVYYSPGATLIRLLALQGASSPLHPSYLIVIPPLYTQPSAGLQHISPSLSSRTRPAP